MAQLVLALVSAFMIDRQRGGAEIAICFMFHIYSHYTVLPQLLLLLLLLWLLPPPHRYNYKLLRQLFISD